MVRMSNQQFDSVYDALSQDTKELVDNKYPFSNGSWIHYRVLSKEQLLEIEMLLSSKCS